MRLGRYFRPMLDAAASIVMVVAGLVIIWQVTKTSRSQPQAKAIVAVGKKLSIDGAIVKGSPTAPLVIVQFSDFQCPFCKRFALDTFPDLDQRYILTGKVFFVYKHLPIDSIHRLAVRSANQSECAWQQGHFWDYFRDINRLSTITAETLDGMAGALAIDQKQFAKCMEAPSQRIANNLAEAKELGLSGTPTFLLGRISDGEVIIEKTLSGAQPVETFERLFGDLNGTPTKR